MAPSGPGRRRLAQRRPQRASGSSGLPSESRRDSLARRPNVDLSRRHIIHTGATLGAVWGPLLVSLARSRQLRDTHSGTLRRAQAVQWRVFMSLNGEKNDAENNDNKGRPRLGHFYFMQTCLLFIVRGGQWLQAVSGWKAEG